METTATSTSDEEDNNDATDRTSLLPGPINDEGEYLIFNKNCEN
jgi:hypothetical protein